MLRKRIHCWLFGHCWAQCGPDGDWRCIFCGVWE